MDYELVEKLRDAGFPNIEIRGGDGKLPCGADSCFHNHDRSPTLEELIKECGDGFCMLHQHPRENKILFWAASRERGCFVAFKERISGVGDTPEEAVANLWLNLNEK